MDFLKLEQRFKVKLNTQDINIFSKEEPLMAIGNGRLVSRGTNDEMNCFYSKETYKSRFFNKTSSSEVEELVNIPDFQEYILLINGQKIDFRSSNVHNYNKELDLKYGYLTRSFFIYYQDIEIKVKIVKYYDMYDKDSFNMVFEFECSKDLDLEFIDKIDGTYTNQGVEHLILEEKTIEDDSLKYYAKTNNDSEIYIQSFLKTNKECKKDFIIKRKKINRILKFKCKKNETIKIDKIVTVNEKEFVKSKSEKKKHEQKWDEIWNQVQIDIKGDAKWQNMIDYSTYHLIINSNIEDSNVNLAAKGLTGFGYKGHTFWDTELFLLPFYILNFPKLSQNLLVYRYKQLEQAKLKAKRYGYQGAMFPWEGTSAQSEDATPEYGPINIKTGKVEKIVNKEIELHINLAVVYGFDYYYDITKDKEFISKYGVEVFVQNAIFWLSRVTYNETLDMYEILNVIGPDEYKEHVDNNAYTNYMVKYSLDLLFKYQDLGIISETDLKEINLDKLEQVYKKLKIQQLNEKGLIPQDDTYLSLKQIDLSKFKEASNVAAINKEYSMEEKCQIQVSKQADLLLLFQVFKDKFEDSVKEKNFYYYEDKCLHDSSLSLTTHSIVAADLNDTEFAKKLVDKSLNIDYDGALNSSDEGIHFASMGGHWLSLIRGFVNVVVADKLVIDPKLPVNITSLSFKLYYKYKLLSITVTKQKIKVSMLTKGEVEIVLKNKEIILKEGETYECTV